MHPTNNLVLTPSVYNPFMSLANDFTSEKFAFMVFEYLLYWEREKVCLLLLDPIYCVSNFTTIRFTAGKMNARTSLVGCKNERLQFMRFDYVLSVCEGAGYYCRVFIVRRSRTGFDKSSLERLEQLFRKTVGNEREIRREDFKKIVTSKNVRSMDQCAIAECNI